MVCRVRDYLGSGSWDAARFRESTPSLARVFSARLADRVEGRGGTRDVLRKVEVSPSRRQARLRRHTASNESRESPGAGASGSARLQEVGEGAGSAMKEAPAIRLLGRESNGFGRVALLCGQWVSGEGT